MYNVKMDEELMLVKPGLEYQEELLAYRRETLAIEPEIHGDGGWDKAGSLEGWLLDLKNREAEDTCPPGFVPSSTWLCIRKTDGRMVGFIDIRHRLNDFLLDFGGHIGYSIRPDERGCGYALRQLWLGLQKCREMGLNRVLLTCDEDNLRSRRTILSAGGVYEDTRQKPGDRAATLRYWIDVAKT